MHANRGTQHVNTIDNENEQNIKKLYDHLRLHITTSLLYNQLLFPILSNPIQYGIYDVPLRNCSKHNLIIIITIYITTNYEWYAI